MIEFTDAELLALWQTGWGYSADNDARHNALTKIQRYFGTHHPMEVIMSDQDQDDAQETGAEKLEETRSEDRGTAQDVPDEPSAGPVLSDERATEGTANQTPDGTHPGTEQMEESDIGSDSAE